MSSATLPAVQGNGKSNHYPIDRDAVLKAVGLNLRDANAQALLLTCERYGLDPILKHMVLIQGRPYVTRDGLLHVAHCSGQFDGIEVLEQGENATHHTAKVAVYRKDMGRPFTYIGRYPKNGGNKAYGPEMAVKCGEVMALRRAFNVALCAREEMWDQDVDATPTARATINHEDDDRQAINEAFTPAPDWNAYLSDRLDEARKHWATEMGLANVPPDLQKHPDNQMPGFHEVVNHFVSRAIDSGAIKPEDVAKDGKPGVRDAQKAKAALVDLYRRAPKRIRTAVDEYLSEKERVLRVRLGMDGQDDVDPDFDDGPTADEDGLQEREPGEDG